MKSKNRYCFFSRCGEEVVGFIANLTPALILGFGGYLIMKGQLTLGTLIGFYSYVDWLYSSVRVLSQYYVSLQRAGQILKRVKEIYDLPEEDIHSGKEKLNDVEKIRCEEVSFSYDDKPILSGVNLHVSKGERIAIVGASGSGKSTLLNLLPRFYDPQGGRIEVNDRDIKEFVLESLRKNVIIVSHRLSTIRKAERIVVLDEGKVVAEGTHDELLKKCSKYREIVSWYQRIPIPSWKAPSDTRIRRER